LNPKLGQKKRGGKEKGGEEEPGSAFRKGERRHLQSLGGGQYLTARKRGDIRLDSGLNSKGRKEGVGKREKGRLVCPKEPPQKHPPGGRMSGELRGGGRKKKGISNEERALHKRAERHLERFSEKKRDRSSPYHEKEGEEEKGKRGRRNTGGSHLMVGRKKMTSSVKIRAKKGGKENAISPESSSKGENLRWSAS